jgi:putative holliday junction resolvase
MTEECRKTRIMAIDSGQKRIGIALSDPLCMFASPWGTIEGGSHDEVAKKISEIVREHEVAMIVVGLPRNMDGTYGSQAEDAESLADFLEHELRIPVEMVDERRTSREAEGLLIDAGVSRKGRKKATDRIAAAIILKRYLERLNRGSC